MRFEITRDPQEVQRLTFNDLEIGDWFFFDDDCSTIRIKVGNAAYRHIFCVHAPLSLVELNHTHMVTSKHAFNSTVLKVSSVSLTTQEFK